MRLSSAAPVFVQVSSGGGWIGRAGRAFLGCALVGAEARGQSPLCGPPAGPGRV